MVELTELSILNETLKRRIHADIMYGNLDGYMKSLEQLSAKSVQDINYFIKVAVECNNAEVLVSLLETYYKNLPINEIGLYQSIQLAKHSGYSDVLSILSKYVNVDRLLEMRLNYGC